MSFRAICLNSYRSKACNSNYVNGRKYHAILVGPTTYSIELPLILISHRYDRYAFDHANPKEDEIGLHRSANWIHDLFLKRNKITEYPLIVIVGRLSQGGSVAMLTALTTKKPLGGVYLLSSYVPLRKKLSRSGLALPEYDICKSNNHIPSQIVTEFGKQTPIFWGHGMEDRQVDFSVWKGLAEVLAGQLEISFISPNPSVKMTREELKKNGALGLRFYSYEDLPHWFNQKELEDLAIWISVLVEDK